MLTIGGLIFLLACVFGSYLASGGSVKPLVEAMPFELVTIGGAAIATFVMANSLYAVNHTLAGVGKVLKGGEQMSCSFTIPIPNYPAPKVDECDMPKAERIAAAKKFFAAAGFGPDKKLSLTITSQSTDSDKKRAEVIAVMWKQVLGVDAKVNAVDREAWNNTFTAGNWDAYADDLVGDFVGPEPYLAYMDPRAGAGYNWESKDYENLWDKAMSITDQAERYKVLAQAEKLILDSYYLTPNYSSPNRHLVRKTVKGWVDSPGDVVATRFLSVETQ